MTRIRVQREWKGGLWKGVGHRERAAEGGRAGESEHKILLTASRPNLIPRAELGARTSSGRGIARGVRGRWEGSRWCWPRRDKSSCRWLTTARIRVYICTYSGPPAPLSSSSCTHRYGRPPVGSRTVPFCRRKDRLINSLPLVINSTLVGHAQLTDYSVPETRMTRRRLRTLDPRGEMIGTLWFYWRAS